VVHSALHGLYWQGIDTVLCLQCKPNMVAFRQMKNKVTPERVVGHIPGIIPGDKFSGKGELAIVGLHCSIASGIYYK
jgi:hypothetical protein